MKYALLTLLFLLVSFPLAAQEIYDLERQQSFSDLFRAPAQQNIVAPEQETDTIAQAEKLISTFFENCTAQVPEAVLSKKVRDDICACSTGKMMEIIKPGEIVTMFSDTPEAKTQQLRLAVLGIIPCMEQPATERAYKACMKLPETSYEWKKPKEVCTCLATEMGKFVIGQGSEPIILNTPTLGDLFLKFTANSGYESVLSNNKRKCVWAEEKGWK